MQQRQQELDDLKRKLAKTTEEEIYLAQTESEKTGTAHAVKSELEGLQEEHAFEKLTQHQYMHMLGRMKADLISSQLRSQDLKDSMKSKKEIAEEETEK